MKKHVRPISVILACHVLSACQTLPLFNPVAEPERIAGETKPPSSLPRPKESNGQGFFAPPTTPPTTVPVTPPTNQPVVLNPPLIIPASVPQELTPPPLTPENIVSEPQTGQEAVKGEVLVLASSQPQLEQALRLSGGEILQARRQTGVVKLSLPAGADPFAMAQTLRQSGIPSLPNILLKATQNRNTATQDPFWGEISNSTCDGARFEGGDPLAQDWALLDINLPQAWAAGPTNFIRQNRNRIPIAAIEFGSENHPDLRMTQHNGVGFDPTSQNEIGNISHGNHVSGIINAIANNNQGLSGVLQGDADYHIYRCTTTFDCIGQTLEQAAEDGMRVINLSLEINYTEDINSPIPDNDLQNRVDATNAFLRPSFNLIRERNPNTLIIPAAGNGITQTNENRPVGIRPIDARFNSPASLSLEYENVLTVAALRPNHQLTDFSNFGAAVRMGAPGDDIFSAVNRDAYCIKDGTSMAAPLVAGTAALVWLRFPDLTLGQVRRALLEGAQPLIGQTFPRLDALGAMRQAEQIRREQMRLNLSQTQIEAGQGISISGSGFQANGQVDIFVQLTAGPLQTPTLTAQTDANGNFTTRYTTTSQMLAGTYSVWGVDRTMNLQATPVALTLSAPPAPPQPLAPPMMTVSPTEGRPGNTFVLSGSQFTPGGSVLVQIFAPNGGNPFREINTRADETGRISLDFNSQLSDIAGQYALIARDINSQRLTAPQSFTILAPIFQPNPLVAVQPGSGIRGSVSFSQNGSGFTPNSTVELFFQKPDGTIFPALMKTTDNGGNYQHSYTSQNTDQVGTYLYWARDIASDSTSPAVAYNIQPSPVAPPPANRAPVIHSMSVSPSSATVAPGQQIQVQLQAAATDPDGQTLSYRWLLNGNLVATSQNTTIQVPSGSHTVRLEVSDGQLNATRQQLLEVRSQRYVFFIEGSASTGSGGGTWSSILNLNAQLNGETLTLTARKKSGNFTTPGTAYLKVGTFEPWGVNHAQGPISAGTPGRELTDEKPMSAYGSGWPKAFYIRIENSGGHAWVGPITVNRRLE